MLAGMLTLLLLLNTSQAEAVIGRLRLGGSAFEYPHVVEDIRK
ncbi:MAG: hypothetical protein ACI8S6_004404 [Myxococcota bacterium]|jgi:hypothetical protein